MQAQKDGYKSRAAYKLLQIHEKFQIFKKGNITIDLGAAPGGWSQIAAKLSNATSTNKLVIALDLLPMDKIAGVSNICGNFLDEQIQNKIWTQLGDHQADAVISDMAPNTTGERSTDYLRIMHLCSEAFSFAQKALKPGGSFIAKVFRGGTDHNILKEIKNHFTTVKHFKPLASRQESTEMYLIALGFKNLLNS
ncbi:ribosomal RNA large subunit methyltransferase E [Candidatus Phycorickettsia trachydisci]|uniref:Ribosomal RNA large subunit methyltransferase E n=1 Tax=Candidatus Phycorickettsia trachydisci TaxID=2115978 RepID=A0A2P1P706_9RICK|nr:RlmE family RNA methyltransferase [Candidatus Phycorickettsia trachydisci]AVP87051.1 ribosomal RNA large subunit methyltransferase E [Candidatus Phycorickettsia trachydisci]